jgi:hypothetical protein
MSSSSVWKQFNWCFGDDAECGAWQQQLRGHFCNTCHLSKLRCATAATAVGSSVAALQQDGSYVGLGLLGEHQPPWFVGSVRGCCCD